MANSWNLLRFTFLSILVGLSAFAAVGCGGGGGGNNDDTGGMNLFISDDLSTDYDQVWVTIHQVEVQSSTGTYRTVFTSSEGMTVDLHNLNDGNARFLYMGNEQIAAGEYSGARVTMGRNLTVVATGETFGEACVFDPSLNFGTTQSRAEFDFANNLTVSGTDNLVIDFDIANWQKVGALVTPAFLRGSDATLGDPNRQEVSVHSGTVQSLSTGSGSSTFRLSKPGGDIDVTMDSNTVVYEEDSSPNPTLSNNTKVEVHGRFDTASNRLMATVIVIDDGQAELEVIAGQTSNLSVLNNTVDVYADRIDGFLPLNAIVQVEFDTTTQFFSHTGTPMTINEVLLELGAGAEVEVEGAYTQVDNSMKAEKVRIVSETDVDVKAQGTASNLNTLAGSFDVALDTWYGFHSSAGQTVSVTTGVGTTFYNEDDDIVSSTDFFAALQAGDTVQVEGEISGSTIAATSVRLKDFTGGASEAKGYVSIASEVSGTVTISLIEWSGFNGGFADQVVVQTTGSTQFEDADGNIITATQFFAGLSIGRVIDAQGTFSAGVLTATRARLRD